MSLKVQTAAAWLLSSVLLAACCPAALASQGGGGGGGGQAGGGGGGYGGGGHGGGGFWRQLWWRLRARVWRIWRRLRSRVAAMAAAGAVGTAVLTTDRAGALRRTVAIGITAIPASGITIGVGGIIMDLGGLGVGRRFWLALVWLRLVLAGLVAGILRLLLPI